ncbi:MAG TPA: aminotransferase class I/II-fold pyridoxal phosphate-dependent enzyme [Candidatus Hydrothermia bacterium]|nr:aminotransferase class I/II-fold pyridoxal phosphate-dependent enzyme [Candidatus Hydrothermae bacterium]MDD3648857.1 aminotransferase class I/II-fold pyridoxal phosphate-dependent enzyme [Candidatus Hydrothermia bacterium]HOK23098.1 aminotransferase class I/II-fold pyridoxal phosphate-dependent enzyme [Candidatus Hydrothermia bacterium]HOL23802.1 aminotransferase class I/II-fold pyridoxal phosphate-dependent enzyme [Candidatus Hydrothermia bacterium]HOP31940.1 aminotransferase class I/II-fo
MEYIYESNRLCGPWIIWGKKRILNLGGGDILGFTSNVAFQKLLSENIFTDEILNRPRFLSEEENIYKESARVFSQFKGFEDAILFSDPYTPFLTILESLIPQGLTLLIDEHFDPSMTSFLNSLTNRITFFPHNSIEQLEKALSEKNEGLVAILVQTLYPLSSDFVPLNRIVELSNKNESTLIIFESWADGLVGSNGQGIYAISSQLPPKAYVFGSLSHILPFPPSYLMGSRNELNHLRENSITIKSSSNISYFQMSILRWFVKTMQSETSLLKKLYDNANYLRYELLSRRFKILGEFTPLIPILIGEKEKTTAFRNYLLSNNILVNKIVFPLVPPGKSRTLIIPSVYHIKDDLDFAIEKITEAGEFLGII